jgi:hypothetical protein
MTLSFTKTWESGDVVTAEHLNANFGDIASIINGGITDTHISTAANIGAGKISDRYSLVKTVYNIVPYSATAGTDMIAVEAGGASARAFFYAPSTTTQMARHEVIGNSGQEGSLVAIGAYVNNVNVGVASKYPVVKVSLNTTLIGQQILLDTDDSFYRLHSNTPFSSPLLSLSDKDVIDISLGTESGGAGAGIRGLWVTIFERWPIAS